MTFNSPRHSRHGYLLLGIAAGAAASLWWWLSNSASASEHKIYPHGEVDTLSKGILEDHSPIIEYRNTFMKHASNFLPDGERVMSFEDFMEVMEAEFSDEYYSEEQLRSLFKIADTGHDGHLDLAEFILFQSLLSKPSASLHISFRIFDQDGDGFISKEEFDAVVNDQWGSEYVTLHRDWFDKFFQKQDQKLSYEEFTKMLADLNRAARLDQFESLAVDGKVSAQDFAQLVYKFDELSLPVYVKNYLKELQDENRQINSEYFLNFVRVYRHLLQAERTIRVYTGAGGKLDKERFMRALLVTSNVDLSPAEAEIFFEMFDVDHDGILDFATYQSIMDTRFGSFRLYNPDKRPLSTMESLFLGLISSAVGGTAVYPLDKLKTRLQSSHTGATIQSTIRTIIAEEGLRGFYSGLQAQICGIVPEKTLKLFANDWFRRQLRTNPDIPLSLPRETLAGIGTGLVQVAISTPYEMIKIRLQMESGQNRRGVVAIVKDIGSVSKLYTGLGATLFRDIPFNMLYFTLYAYLKRVMVDKHGEISGMRLLVAGAVAAASAAAIDTPADVVKTRLQNGKEDYKGIVDCIRRIHKEEGLRAFGKGMQVRMIVIAPLFAITFTTYELLKRLWRPNSESPIDLLEEHADAMRRTRLKRVAKDLKREFGLEMRVTGQRGL